MKHILKGIVYVFAIIGFLLVLVYIAVQFGWTKTPGIIDRQHDFFKNEINSSTPSTWQQSEEWNVLKQAVQKDRDIIHAVAQKTDISPRLIVAVLIVEQMRLFNSEREIFKSIFSPLKILGNQSQFSWGVMGIKQDTAIEVEQHLKDTSSPWYLGSKYEHMLDFETTDSDTERFMRLTDEHDRTFSYLYASLLLKQLMFQWEKAGIDISDRPEILATLFNIGFINSRPHADPLAGGAEIEIGSEKYSFGGLAGSFYYSDELKSEFPKK